MWYAISGPTPGSAQWMVILSQDKYCHQHAIQHQDISNPKFLTWSYIRQHSWKTEIIFPTGAQKKKPWTLPLVGNVLLLKNIVYLLFRWKNIEVENNLICTTFSNLIYRNVTVHNHYTSAIYTSKWVQTNYPWWGRGFVVLIVVTQSIIEFMRTTF